MLRGFLAYYFPLFLDVKLISTYKDPPSCDNRLEGFSLKITKKDGPFKPAFLKN